MQKTIAVLPGDGIGPEIIEESINILNAVAKKFNHMFEYKYGLIGASAIDKTGDPFPKETEEICRTSDAILFGAIGDPKYDNDPRAKVRPEQGILRLRKSLELFANIRPVSIYPELFDISPLKNEKLKNVDFIMVRELTGGIYFGEKKRFSSSKSASDVLTYSKDEIKRIAKKAFDLAKKRKKKVTSVDKANVLETSRLWRETVNEISQDYSGVELNHLFVDNTSMQIIKRPSEFDVILTENMFGDILSDEASVLAGSIGLLPSASIGEKYALYEPIHGAFNKAAGKNIANPVGTILSAAMMLRLSFKMEEEAQVVENAVKETIKDGKRTKDTAPSQETYLGTKEFGEIIKKNCL